MHFNGLKLSGAWKGVLSLRDFGVRKCKNEHFEENKLFNCCFYQIKGPVITNPSSRLEKHQILEFLLMTDFLKIVCVLFYVNMFDQAHYSLISPFSYDIFFKTKCF